MNDAKTKLLQDDVPMWRAREEALVRKIEMTMKNVFLSIDKYVNVEEQIVGKIRSDMEKLATKKSSKNEIIVKSISEIRQSIQLEEENRKFSDEEIMNAINNYTGSLQRGLQQVIANKM